MTNSLPDPQAIVNRVWYIFGVIGAFITILQLKEDYHSVCFKLIGSAAILIALFCFVLDHISKQHSVYMLLNLVLVVLGAILWILPPEPIKSTSAVGATPTPTPTASLPPGVNPLLVEGENLYKEGKYRAAIEKLEVVTSSTDEPMAHFYSGSAHLRVRPGPECDQAAEHLGRLKGGLRERLAAEFESVNCRDN